MMLLETLSPDLFWFKLYSQVDKLEGLGHLVKFLVQKEMFCQIEYTCVIWKPSFFNFKSYDQQNVFNVLQFHSE